ncbi:putative methyltransferase [Porphyridium purpureum]|uniref:Putative methyltransferase n=1 Tax=Porphyridium purpureum TaxID=35688 RepID=A0A5J4Z115_PORPP|nr:putative methyltransferase [Porphyridium purpureum]|eukprot:POR0189..scf295_1
MGRKRKSVGDGGSGDDAEQNVADADTAPVSVPKKKERKRNRKKKDAPAQVDAAEDSGGNDVEEGGNGVSRGNDVDGLEEQRGRREGAQQQNAGRAAQAPRRTISIAFPSSIVNAVVKHEMQTLLCGQLARAAAQFRVREIILFEEFDEDVNMIDFTRPNTAASEASAFIKLLLEYIETPPYLRKFFFPVSDDLRYVGLLIPLEAPHHLKINELLRFREGVVVPQGFRQGDSIQDAMNGSTSKTSKFVELGLRFPMRLRSAMPMGTRVTADFGENDLFSMPSSRFNNLVLTAASREDAEQATGAYWGYKVKVVTSLSRLLDEARRSSAYDLIIGTSDEAETIMNTSSVPRSFDHALVVFGGLRGLRHAAASDAVLVKRGMIDERVPELFDMWVNTIPRQGTQSVRTEEAIPITLATLAHNFET